MNNSTRINMSSTAARIIIQSILIIVTGTAVLNGTTGFADEHSKTNRVSRSQLPFVPEHYSSTSAVVVSLATAGTQATLNQAHMPIIPKNLNDFRQNSDDIPSELKHMQVNTQKGQNHADDIHIRMDANGTPVEMLVDYTNMFDDVVSQQVRDHVLSKTKLTKGRIQNVAKKFDTLADDLKTSNVFQIKQAPKSLGKPIKVQLNNKSSALLWKTNSGYAFMSNNPAATVVQVQRQAARTSQFLQDAADGKTPYQVCSTKNLPTRRENIIATRSTVGVAGSAVVAGGLDATIQYITTGSVDWRQTGTTTLLAGTSTSLGVITSASLGAMGCSSALQTLAGGGIAGVIMSYGMYAMGYGTINDAHLNASVGLAVASMSAVAPAALMTIAMTFGTASTGTAISTLSGAAATNAALAWLGGGTLAAGGGGVAGGMATLTMASGGAMLVVLVPVTIYMTCKFFADAKAHHRYICGMIDITTERISKGQQPEWTLAY